MLLRMGMLSMLLSFFPNAKPPSAPRVPADHFLAHPWMVEHMEYVASVSVRVVVRVHAMLV